LRQYVDTERKTYDVYENNQPCYAQVYGKERDKEKEGGDRKKDGKRKRILILTTRMYD
jgi:hypothetical protein